MLLLDYMEDAYGVTGKLKLACELLQRILRDFLREAIRHMCLRVCCVKSLSLLLAEVESSLLDSK